MKQQPIFENYRQVFEKRYAHKEIMSITVKPWDSMHANIYIAFFKDGDYVVLADHCTYQNDTLSHQMKKGRWFNVRTKKLLKLDF